MNPHELYTSLTNTTLRIRGDSIAMGQILKELKDNDKYKESVGDIDTWNQFLKQPEIGLSVSEADTLIEIYEEFVQRLGFDKSDLNEISLKNLKKLLPFAKTRGSAEIESYLDQAKMLSDKDFREAMVENQNITDRTYTYSVMKRCKETGSMTKVHGLDSDDIKNKFNLND